MTGSNILKPDPTIVDVVRWAGQDGVMADEVALATGLTLTAALHALAGEIAAGRMSSEEVWDGERYVGTVYRMRGMKS